MNKTVKAFLWNRFFTLLLFVPFSALIIVFAEPEMQCDAGVDTRPTPCPCDSVEPILVRCWETLTDTAFVTGDTVHIDTQR